MEIRIDGNAYLALLVGKLTKTIAGTISSTLGNPDTHGLATAIAMLIGAPGDNVYTIENNADNLRYAANETISELWGLTYEELLVKVPAVFLAHLNLAMATALTPALTAPAEGDLS